MFTPEATMGPFYPDAFTPQMAPAPAVEGVEGMAGQAIRLCGRFLDSHGDPVPSLIVEFWQANAHGRYRHPLDRSGFPLDPRFDGFVRLRTAADGVYSLTTIKPGARGNCAPHLRLTIFASGIDRLVTRVFFEDEALNRNDPVLNCIPDPVLRRRLIAVRTSDNVYTLDIVLRGQNETPFFDDWAS